MWGSLWCMILYIKLLRDWEVSSLCVCCASILRLQAFPFYIMRTPNFQDIYEHLPTLVLSFQYVTKMINTNYLDSILLLQSKNTNRYQSFSECLRVARYFPMICSWKMHLFQSFAAKIDENIEKVEISHNSSNAY